MQATSFERHRYLRMHNCLAHTSDRRSQLFIYYIRYFCVTMWAWAREHSPRHRRKITNRFIIQAERRATVLCASSAAAAAAAAEAGSGRLFWVKSECNCIASDVCLVFINYYYVLRGVRRSISFNGISSIGFNVVCGIFSWLALLALKLNESIYSIRNVSWGAQHAHCAPQIRPKTNSKHIGCVFRARNYVKRWMLACCLDNRTKFGRTKE